MAQPLSVCVWSPRDLRLRNEAGRKWTVAGSRNGIFLPMEFIQSKRLVVCEGPTDTAAAMCLALPAIGRPSCSGGVDFILQYCERVKAKELIIIADRDDVGRAGAEKLANKARCRVKIVAPYGHKDVRSWLQSGAKPLMAKSIIDNATTWRNKK